MKILEILTEVRESRSIDEVARLLDVHPIDYRLLRTLETHRLICRDAVGHVQLVPEWPPWPPVFPTI
jgi:DNA-binding IclR family transcriptional regulator